MQAVKDFFYANKLGNIGLKAIEKQTHSTESVAEEKDKLWKVWRFAV